MASEEVTEAAKRKSVTFNKEELGPTGSGIIGGGTEEAARSGSGSSSGGVSGNGKGNSGSAGGGNGPANSKVVQGNPSAKPNDIGRMAAPPPAPPPMATQAADAPKKPSALSATPPPAPSASPAAEAMSFDFKPERTDRGAASDSPKEEGAKASGGGGGGGGGGGSGGGGSAGANKPNARKSSRDFDKQSLSDFVITLMEFKSDDHVPEDMVDTQHPHLSKVCARTVRSHSISISISFDLI